MIARSDKGELALRREPIDVATLLASVATRFEWRAADAGREIVQNALAGTFVSGDRIRLEQALGNLVDNALRHGGGTVHLEAVTERGRRVALYVRDDGVGFPPEFLPRAFERFTRPSSDRRGGTGLGLSIVRTIAVAHGGSVVAVNGERGGADVCVVLPALVRSEASHVGKDAGRPNTQ
ncbi:MAG: HAMP domain-containing histidine kinase [Actinobacteria bacterium]|nr:MAG: HAMP domain-containing histidine kinase [Actinomycetota bacterium]